MPSLDPSLIRGLELFRAMSEEQLRAVLVDAHSRQVAKGTALFEQGMPAREFFVLLDGRLKVMQLTPAGDQVVMRFVGPGEVCGVAIALRRPEYPATALAVVDCVVLAWESRHWESLCARAPMLAANTLHTIGQRLQDAHARIREFSTEEAERRVAHALLRLVGQSGRKTAKGIELDFPLSRQDIAEMTGLTLHTVSRIMSGWEGKGLVEGGRQRVVVREAHRLLVIAEGDKPVD